MPRSISLTDSCRSGSSLLRARLVELLVYGAMTLGIMVLVGADSYLQYPSFFASYGQARYLLPMIRLLGAIVALAAEPVDGAGARYWEWRSYCCSSPMTPSASCKSSPASTANGCWRSTRH